MNNPPPRRATLPKQWHWPRSTLPDVQNQRGEICFALVGLDCISFKLSRNTSPTNDIILLSAREIARCIRERIHHANLSDDEDEYEFNQDQDEDEDEDDEDDENEDEDDEDEDDEESSEEEDEDEEKDDEDEDDEESSEDDEEEDEEKDDEDEEKDDEESSEESEEDEEEQDVPKKGSSVGKVFEYVSKYGATLRRDYTPAPRVWINGYTLLQPPEVKLTFSRGSDEPVASSCKKEDVLWKLQEEVLGGEIHIYGSFHEFRGNGIYEGPTSHEKKFEESEGHSILIYGYGESDGIKFFYIKNSWGNNWGDGGYGKIRRDLVDEFAFVHEVTMCPHGHDPRFP